MALLHHNPIGFIALFVWPAVLGLGLVAYGVTAPPGGLFGIGRDSTTLATAVFVAAGVAAVISSFTINVAIRSAALGLVLFATLGRTLTMVVAGTADLTRPRELGAAAIFGLLFAAVTLIHFMAIPDAGKLDVDKRGGPGAVNG
jgi:hypothetical protein